MGVPKGCSGNVWKERKPYTFRREEGRLEQWGIEIRGDRLQRNL